MVSIIEVHDIIQKIILDKNKINHESINYDSEFKDVFGWTSLVHLYFVKELQDRYQITFNSRDVVEIKTIRIAHEKVSNLT